MLSGKEETASSWAATVSACSFAFFFFWLLFCTLLRGRRTPPPAPSELLLRRAEGCNFHGRNRDSPVPPPSSYRREKRSWARMTHAAGAEEEEDAQHSPTAGAGCCREPGRAAPRCPPGGEGLQSPATSTAQRAEEKQQQEINPLPTPPGNRNFCFRGTGRDGGEFSRQRKAAFLGKKCRFLGGKQTC